MTCNPLRRDSTWRVFQPGCWFDPDGNAHLFPDEVLAHLQILHPESGFSHEDIDMIVETFASLMRDAHPGIEIRVVEHEREQPS